MTNFFINPDYICRLHNQYYDDTNSRDEWQREVYLYAKKIFDENKFSSILDIGCGSAYKLIEYFADYETLGMDLPQTVNWLKEKYPTRVWSDKFEPIINYDMIIAADVIEHIPNPNILLDLIENCNAKMIIFSTPDRNLLDNDKGPPHNLAHVREWSMSEFYAYIGSRFSILDHFISNRKQATQVILAKNKK